MDVGLRCRASRKFRRADLLAIAIHPGTCGERLCRIDGQVGWPVFPAHRRQRKDGLAAAVVEDRVALVNRAQDPTVVILADPKANDAFARLIDKYADRLPSTHDSAD